jgi:hypothetical protein
MTYITETFKQALLAPITSAILAAIPQSSHTPRSERIYEAWDNCGVRGVS